jgi:hypothetical protein
MSVKYINIVHHSHTDFGYTDHPLRARELQRRYIDDVVDYTLGSLDKSPPFAWTCETLIPVWDWWQAASSAEQERFLRALDAGVLDVMGLPFNITAFLSAMEWDYMMDWIPRELWDRMRINCAMQNDVNGLHTGGIMKLMDRGIHSLWIGPNTYNALPPLPTPGAFWWKMPDGRRLFVWLNASYCDGYFIFNPNWRQGPVPNSTDLRYRPPREGEMFNINEESMYKSHALCVKNIAMIEGSGPPNAELSRDGFTQNKIYGSYPYANLCVSVTNQWRIDNDPPFYPLRSFVEKWNGLGLKPQLRLTTASQAMAYIREEAGNSPAEYSGEWPDWWANGTPSLPVELSLSRKAKRILESARSPVFGGTTWQETTMKDAALYNLCMFDEHTYGSWAGTARPYSFEARSGRAEKDIFAYRALDSAQALLAAKTARLYDVREEGIFIINPDTNPYSGWIELPANCLRGAYSGMKNYKTGGFIPFEFIDGNGDFTRPVSPDHISDEDISETFADKLPRQLVRAWLEKLPPCSVARFIPGDGDPQDMPSPIPNPEILTDSQGWPVYARIGDTLLFDSEPGGFLSITAKGFGPRWIFKDIFIEENPEERQKMAAERLSQIPAEYPWITERTENDHELVFTQKFSHPSLTWGKRILRIYKAENKVAAALRLNRRSNHHPEIYYASFEAVQNAGIPMISNAGGVFVPGSQIPGSCMDYYAIDGWVFYQIPGGGKQGENGWLISSRDAAVVSFNYPHVSQRIHQFPRSAPKVLFMLFNNTWDTNFAADSHGVMEFTFDIAPCDDVRHAEALAWSLTTAPVVAVNLR